MSTNGFDFDEITARNDAFANSAEDPSLTRSDLTALSMLVELCDKQDDDGYGRNAFACETVGMGDAGAARTITHFAGPDSEASFAHLVIELWGTGAACGIFERGHDYSATEQDRRYFEQFITFFSEWAEDFMLMEMEDESMRALARLFRSTELEVDIDLLGQYLSERGVVDEDGVKAYLAEHPALRSGTL